MSPTKPEPDDASDEQLADRLEALHRAIVEGQSDQDESDDALPLDDAAAVLRMLHRARPDQDGDESEPSDAAPVRNQHGDSPTDRSAPWSPHASTITLQQGKLPQDGSPKDGSPQNAEVGETHEGGRD